MLKRTGKWTFFAAGAVSGATLAILLGPSLSNSVAASRTQKIVAQVAQSGGPSLPAMTIVPADVMDRTAPWAPLTGDGSN